MIFFCIDNQFVEFKIANYEFPNVIDDEYDSNWLLIYIKVKSNLGNWQTIDSSLLTWETTELLDWFKMLLADRKPKYDNLNFIEPNLSFKLLDFNKNVKHFRIEFDLESKPQSAKEGQKYFVDCSVNKFDLQRIVMELEQEIKKYPKR